MFAEETQGGGPFDRRRRAGEGEVEGAVESLARLQQSFAGKVFLVSTANERIAARTLAWLRERGFFERTGIPESHLCFCTTREEKARVAQRLALTHFIDDRLDVLGHLHAVPNRVLFASEKRPPVGGIDRRIVLCTNWHAAETAVQTGQRKAER